MEAEPVSPKPTPGPDQENDTTEEVAETTAPLHFEGKGLDREIERRHEDTDKISQEVADTEAQAKALKEADSTAE